MALSESGPDDININNQKLCMTINFKHYSLNDMGVNQLRCFLSTHYGIQLSTSNKNDYINAIIKQYFTDAVDINDSYKQVFINSKTYDELMDILEECFGYTFDKFKNSKINTKEDCKRAIFIELNPYPLIDLHVIIKNEDDVTFTTEELEKIDYYVNNFTLVQLQTKLCQTFDYNHAFVLKHLTCKNTTAEKIVVQEILQNKQKQDEDDDCIDCLDNCECHFWFCHGSRRHRQYRDHDKSSNDDFSYNKGNDHNYEHCTDDICVCCKPCHCCDCYLSRCKIGDLFNFQCNLGDCSSNSLDLFDLLSKISDPHNRDIYHDDAGTCIGGCMCGFVVGFFIFLVLLIKALVELQFDLILDGLSVWIAVIVIGIMASCLFEQLNCCDACTDIDCGCDCNCKSACRDFTGCICALCENDNDPTRALDVANESPQQSHLESQLQPDLQSQHVVEEECDCCCDLICGSLPDDD